jgi:hypothetical protein
MIANPHWQWLFLCLLVPIVQCAANQGDGDDEGAGDSGASGYGGSLQDGGARGGSGGQVGTPSGGGGEQAGAGNVGGQAGGLAQDGSDHHTEVCDGVDNDDNGIIDDVDVNSDGVCDCLNVATIGEIGPWSNGGDVFKNWLTARSPNGYVALGDQVLTDDLLKPFQVIVVLYSATFTLYGNNGQLPPHHAFSDLEVAAFERWVRNGGGAMTTIGYAGDEYHEIENVNQLLAPLGMGYSKTKLDLGGYVKNWAPHELTTEVRNIFIDNGVEPDGPNGISLAWDQNNKVALQVTQANRILVRLMYRFAQHIGQLALGLAERAQRNTHPQHIV